MRKRLLIFAGAGLSSLLLLAAVVPMFFAGTVVERASAAASEQLRGDLTIGGASISLFRSFPNLSVALDDVTLTGEGPFADVALVQFGRVDVTVDLGTVLGGGSVRVREIELDGLAVDLQKRDGEANWAITKPRETAPTEGGASLDLALDSLRVRGSVSYRDPASGVEVRVEDLKHESTGNLAATRFQWTMETTVGALHLAMGDTTWLSGTPVSLDADLAVDQSARSLTLERNDLHLSDLSLALTGTLSFPKSRPLQADLAVEAQTPTLAALLSLLPGLATQAAGLEADGAVTLAASVKGPLGGENLPAIVADVTVRDGSVSKAGIPERVEGLQLAAHVDSPGPTLDGLVLDISRLEATVAGNPVSASGRLANPESSLDVTLDAKGVVDLTSVNRLLPSDDPTVGVLDLDVGFDGSIRALAQNARTEAKRGRGTVTIRGLKHRLRGAEETIEVDRATFEVTPKDIVLTDLVGRVGESDLALNGRIENLLGRVLGGEVLVARLNVRGDSIDLDEVLRAFPQKQDAPDSTEPKSRRAARIPDGYDLRLDAQVKSMKFRELDMDNVRGDVWVHDRQLDIEQLKFGMLDGSFATSGVYDSAPEEPRLDLDLDITKVDITKTVERLGFVGELAPLAAAAEGRISSNLKLGGRFSDGMNLIVDTVGGVGGLLGHGLTLAGSDTLNLAANALGDDSLRTLKLSPLALDFQVEEGRMRVAPFDFTAGPFAAAFGGTHRFGGELDYSLTLQMPAGQFTGQADTALQKLLAKSPLGGASRSALPKVVPVIVGIGGTVAKPKITLDLGAMTKAAGKVVKEQVVEVVKETANKASAAAIAEAERRLAAQLGGAGTLRDTARRSAKRLKQTAYAGADKAVARANGPLAKAAAAIVAETAKQSADRAYDKALKAADRDFAKAKARAQRDFEGALQTNPGDPGG